MSASRALAWGYKLLSVETVLTSALRIMNVFSAALSHTGTQVSQILGLCLCQCLMGGQYMRRRQVHTDGKRKGSELVQILPPDPEGGKHPQGRSGEEAAGPVPELPLWG